MDTRQNYTAKIAIAVVVVAILGAIVWYWYNRPKPIKTTEDAIKALTSTPELEVGSNPVEGKVPDVNPINKVNPFQNSYKNPFTR